MQRVVSRFRLKLSTEKRYQMINSYDHTFDTFAKMCSVIMATISDNNAFSVAIVSVFSNAIRFQQVSLVNVIDRSWIFIVKFMKLAKGSFDKFDTKLPLV